MVGPFLSLFLGTEVHAGPVQITVYLVAAPLAGVLTATALGRLSDRRAIRRALLICASLAGLVSTGLTAFVRDYWLLLGLAVTTTALAGSLFPQTFAYARQALAGSGPGRAAMGISAMRTVFSLAWVAGPALAALLLHTGGFGYVYGAAAAMYAVAALVALVWLGHLGVAAPPAEPPPAVPPVAGSPVAGPRPGARLLLTAAAFTMLQAPLTLGVQAMPLFIHTNLGGAASDAGLILGLCAALEIPLLLGFGALATRVRLRALVLAGAGCGIAYYGLVTLTTAVWVLAAAQVLNALYIAAVSGLGISYMQDMLPAYPGRATTLFTNTFPIGAMLAGPLFGATQHFGFRFAYGAATVLCTAGLLGLLLTPPYGRVSRG